MAEALFGSPTLRVNVAKALQELPFHGARTQRLQYIAQVRQRLALDSLLSHSHRQMSVGHEQYRHIPHWKLFMDRAPGLASPYYIPLDHQYSSGKDKEMPSAEILQPILEKATEKYIKRTDYTVKFADQIKLSIEEQREKLETNVKELCSKVSNFKKKN